MSEIQIREGKRTFSDVLHFPRGFSRSGDFSINDSRLLATYGETLGALANGDISPENEQEQHFIEVCMGEAEPNSKIEMVWIKYLNKTRRRPFFTLCGSERAAAAAMQASSDTILELDE